MAENTSLPLSKMNFLVTVADVNGSAAFTEVSDTEAVAKDMAFRQGNSNHLAPVNIPEIMVYGHVTLKQGYTLDNAIAKWICDSMDASKKNNLCCDVTIELIDTSKKLLWQAAADQESSCVWILKNTWITKYNAPELTSASKVAAIESLDLAFEELYIPGRK